MADKYGKLSTPEIEKILAVLNAKVAGKETCPGCGHNDTTIMDQLMSLIPVSQSGFINSVLLIQDDNPIALRRYVPCVATLCTHCGNIQTYALNSLGIKLDPIPPEEEDKPDGK